MIFQSGLEWIWLKNTVLSQRPPLHESLHFIGYKITKYQNLQQVTIQNSLLLKCGFLKQSLIINAPLVSCPFPVIRCGCIKQKTYPKRMNGNGQLRGAFMIKDFLRNSHFSKLYCSWLTQLSRMTKSLIHEKPTFLTI